MTAKEYLSRLQRIENKIEYYSRESERIRMMLLPKGITYDKDKVQTSVSDKVTEDIAKLIDIDNKYMKLIGIYFEMRGLIVTQIYGLTEQNYVDVLIKRYLEKKPLVIIAEEMGYSPDWIKHLHRKALKNFEKTYEDILLAM